MLVHSLPVDWSRVEQKFLSLRRRKRRVRFATVHNSRHFLQIDRNLAAEEKAVVFT
jgi:hypothetical protein